MTAGAAAVHQGRLVVERSCVESNGPSGTMARHALATDLCMHIILSPRLRGASSLPTVALHVGTVRSDLLFSCIVW